jgi:hypothetical protein
MTTKALMVSDQEQMELDLEQPSDVNPFSVALARGMKTRMRRSATDTNRLAVVNMETAVVEGAAEICRISEVDPEQFMKVFSAQLGAIYALPPRATKLLIVMWDVYSHEAKKRKETAPLDYVEMSLKIYEDMARRNGAVAPSKPTYHRAMKDLMEAGFVSTGDRAGRYWINPAVFFIGSRVRLVQELRKTPEVIDKPEESAEAAEPEMRDITPKPRQVLFEPDGTVLDAETGVVIGRIDVEDTVDA